MLIFFIGTMPEIVAAQPLLRNGTWKPKRHRVDRIEYRPRANSPNTTILPEALAEVLQQERFNKQDTAFYLGTVDLGPISVEAVIAEFQITYSGRDLASFQ